MACPRTVNAAAIATAKALAKYLDVSDAGVQVSAQAHQAYLKAHNCLLARMEVPELSDANTAAITKQAQKYRKVMRGPGCTS